MQNSTNHNPHRNHQRSRNSTSSSSGFNNIRNRTHSWSNVDKRSTSAKPISGHCRQSSAIIPDSRYRTTSEGNAHFDIKPRSIGKSTCEKKIVKTYIFLLSFTDFEKNRQIDHIVIYFSTLTKSCKFFCVSNPKMLLRSTRLQKIGQ